MKSCPFFNKLEQEALEALIEVMPVETVEAGECIVRQGETGDHGFVVLNGSVEVYNEEVSSDSPGHISVNKCALDIPVVNIVESNTPASFAGGRARRGAFVRTMSTG